MEQGAGSGERSQLRISNCGLRIFRLRLPLSDIPTFDF